MNRIMVCWRGVVVGVAMALCGLAVATSLSKSRLDSKHGPKIDCPTQSHDFGVVSPGELLETRFILRNAGDRDLEIKSVRASCGCTTAEASVDRVSPGQAGNVRVAFRPSNVLPVVHRVVIETNDRAKPETELFVSCKPQWAVDVQPAEIHLPNAVAGTNIERKIEVFAPDGGDVRITSTAASASWIQLGVSEGSGRSHFIHAFFRPCDAGGFREQIEMATDNPKRPRIVIPVTGNVLGSDGVHPSRVLLGKRSAGGTVVVPLIIANAGRLGEIASVRIDDGRWASDGFESRRIETDRMLVKVVIKVPDSAGNYRATIVITGNRETVSVPVSCLIGTAETS